MTAASPESVRWLARWINKVGSTLNVKAAAVLVVSVQEIEVRDAAWAAISCSEAGRHIDLWTGSDAGPSTSREDSGSGRVGESGSGSSSDNTDGYSEYTPFDLLHTVLEAGVDPRQWDSMRVAMSTESAIGH